MHRVVSTAILGFTAVTSFTDIAIADEGGVSFWLPGQFDSLAAAPQTPGWQLSILNYYAATNAGGDVAAARQMTIGRLSPTINISLQAQQKASSDVVSFDGSYVFSPPVLGGQFAIGMTGVVGRDITAISGTLTAAVGSLAFTRQGTIDEGRTGFGDLYPQASLRWSSGVNNWMTYVTGDIPVGEYSPTNLANIGIGHGAVDGGIGYTYFDERTGRELSVVTGLTYNMINPSTGYRNGDDWHVDWSASQLLTKDLRAGAVGYYYQQVTADSGCAPILCPFESRVAGIGPQFGFTVPGASVDASVNFKAYWEFDAQARASGWNAWVTLSLSPSSSPPTSVPPPIITKTVR